MNWQKGLARRRERKGIKWNLLHPGSRFQSADPIRKALSTMPAQGTAKAPAPQRELDARISGKPSPPTTQRLLAGNFWESLPVPPS
jgi:hypothetical protein